MKTKVQKQAFSVKDKLKSLGHKVSVSHVYEILAHLEGYKSWNVYQKKLDNPEEKTELDHIRGKQGKFGFYYSESYDDIAYYNEDEYSYEDPENPKDLIFYEGNPYNPEDLENISAHCVVYSTELLSTGLGGFSVPFSDLSYIPMDEVPMDVLENYMRDRQGLELHGEAKVLSSNNYYEREKNILTKFLNKRLVSEDTPTVGDSNYFELIKYSGYACRVFGSLARSLQDGIVNMVTDEDKEKLHKMTEATIHEGIAEADSEELVDMNLFAPLGYSYQKHPNN